MNQKQPDTIVAESENRRRAFPLILICMALITVGVATTATRAGYVPSHDSLYFFFQRTIYLENLTVKGSWWANPAQLCGIDRPTALTANTGPLGGSVTLASVRLLFPVRGTAVAGIGVTGAGDDQERSLNATGSDAEYKSHFIFSRPSLESGIAVKVPYMGSIGVLQSLGAEVVRHREGSSDFFLVWGNGLGWISPPLAGISASVSGLTVFHDHYESWWDHNLKIGLKLTTAQGIDAAIEYAFVPGDDFSLFTSPQVAVGYEALKGSLSITARQIVGILAGFSIDTEHPGRNGTMVHGGLELKQADVYPYFGGYELGLGYANRLTILHRLWVGYRFGRSRN